MNTTEISHASRDSAVLRGSDQASSSQNPGKDAIELRCTGLSLRFGKVRALDGLDLTIAPGECVGVAAHQVAEQAHRPHRIIARAKGEGEPEVAVAA